MSGSAQDELDDGVLSDVRRLIGEEAALLLIAAFGGSDFYLPESPSPAHRVSKLLGHDKALALATEFAGDTISLPVRVPGAREATIERLTRAGATILTITRATGLSARRIRQVRARMRAQGRLPSVAKSSSSSRKAN